MAATHNLTIECGATFLLEMVWSEDDTPKNLTGYAARMQVRKTHAAAPILDLTDGAGITLGTTGGEITIEVSSDDTTDLTEGNYVYDLELESGAGFVTRLLEGGVTIKPEVTR